VLETVVENSQATTIMFDFPDWPGFLAGQHVDVRLTAQDGYQAQRSYSISSAPEDEHVAITVERLDDGEVSPFLTGELRVGDELEMRGPIGGYFVWQDTDGGPVQLIAGGSGVAPLRSILRHHRAIASTVPMRLLCSARSLELLLYRDELTSPVDDRVEITLTLTRDQPPDWAGYGRRVDRDMLVEAAWAPAHQPLCYVCGPTPFVETVAGTLVDLGYDPGRIRTERFGGTGT
jgi:ferredoxin-NADP reductase